MHEYAWGPGQKKTELHGRANLFITTKLNFPLTALRSATLGLLLPVTYGGAGEGGSGGSGGEGRWRGDGAPKMSIEIVSVRGKACLISAHLDFMTAPRSALPDREHYSRILSSPGGTIEESRFIVPIIPAYFICHYEMPSCNDARLFMTD